MLQGRRFQFRPVLTICAAVGLAILISLGVWQLHRLGWKLALIDKIETRVAASPIDFDTARARADAGEDMEYTPVMVSGRIISARSSKVFGTLEGEAGGYIFAPVVSESGRALYVNLGFLPQRLAKSEAGADTPPEGAPTQFVGLLRYPERPTPPASWFRPAGKSTDGFWFIRDPAQFAEEAGIAVPGYYIDRFAVEGGGWPKGGATRLEFRNNHLDYALTWFGLAAVLVAVWLILSLPKR